MGEKLRIAQLVGNAELGGVGNCVLNYFKAADRSRFRFDFLTYGPSALDERIKALGGEVHYLPDFKQFPSACRELKNLLSARDYDIFHSHLTSLSVFPLYVAKRAGIKARICHAHSATDNREKRALAKNILKKFSKRYATDYFACSVYSAEWMFGKGEDVFILPNAIDRERFFYDALAGGRLREQYGVKGLCMGFAGRFEYQKNLSFFLEAARELEKLTDMTAVLVGGGSQADSLRDYAQKLGVNAVFVPGTDKIEKWYSAFDCLALPSRYEGLPLVGVEAQACSLKCFFSDAITKEADIGGAEFLPTADASAWAARIFANGTKRTDAADKLADAGFDIKRTVTKLEKEYERIAEERL